MKALLEKKHFLIIYYFGLGGMYYAAAAAATATATATAGRNII
jgi:hypothetical protein